MTKTMMMKMARQTKKKKATTTRFAMMMMMWKAMKRKTRKKWEVEWKKAMQKKGKRKLRQPNDATVPRMRVSACTEWRIERRTCTSSIVAAAAAG